MNTTLLPIKESRTTSKGPDPVLVLARCVAGIGIAGVVTGIAAWLTVRSQLKAEKIIIPESAARFGGLRVVGPLTAFEEANVIKRTTLKATGGRTYGEMEEDDQDAELAMNASLLRSSLFTSILAFGVAAAEVALGGLLMAIGTALAIVARRLPPDPHARSATSQS